jgi:sugar phosphate isomerase/epimerase
MKIGVCTNLADAQAVKTGGFDYLEASVQELLDGLVPDQQWKGLERRADARIEIPSGNLMVPAALKITGDQVNWEKLLQYMATILERAAKVGMKTIVFGSAGARQVPEGFPRKRAAEQVVEFARACARQAGGFGITIVLEPLAKKECNFVNSLPEAMDIVRAVDHPSFQCLVDSYHFWMEDEPLENLRETMPWIRHVHLADKVGRVAPGESGQSDYRPLFAVLKQGGYNGNLSVEADFRNIAQAGPRVLAFIRNQWNQA